MTELEVMRDFGFNLKAKLQEYQMTQKELSDETGISKPTISGYVNSTHMPSFKNVLNIAYALECDISELIEIEELIV